MRAFWGSYSGLKLAYRLAPYRTDDPGAWIVITGPSSFAGAGDFFAEVDVSALTEAKAAIQFGISHTLSGANATDAQADVEFTISYQSCGKLVGTRTQELNTFNTSTATTTAITGWMPTLGIDYVVCFFLLTGLANTFRCQLWYRTATYSPQDPGAWTNLEAGTYHSSNGESNSTQLSMVTELAGVMYVQFGISYSQGTPANTPATASVTTSVWTRRA